MNHDKRLDTWYLGCALDGVQLRELTTKAVRLLKPYADQFDAIAIRGYSGCLVGPAVAMRLRKDLIIVRKPSEKAHSPLEVEGVISDSYLIIDDQIATGQTINAITTAISAWHEPSKLAGIYLYGHGSNLASRIHRFGCWGIDGHAEKFVPMTTLEEQLEKLQTVTLTA